jgi:hypothetical protein
MVNVLELEDGGYVDLGNGREGRVRIEYANMGNGQTDCDPRYVFHLSIGMETASWEDVLEIEDYGIPLCQGEEGNSMISGPEESCGKRDTIMAIRTRLELWGEEFSVIGLKIKDALHTD